jgi:hypothetical protein
VFSLYLAALMVPSTKEIFTLKFWPITAKIIRDDGNVSVAWSADGFPSQVRYQIHCLSSPSMIRDSSEKQIFGSHAVCSDASMQSQNAIRFCFCSSEST